MALAGQRSTFVRIERYTETRSPTTNAVVKAWTKVAEAWVSFTPLRGTEDYVSNVRESQRVIRLEGDWMELADVKEKDRLVEVDTGRILDVKTVLPMNDTRDTCRLEVTAGEGAR